MPSVEQSSTITASNTKSPVGEKNLANSLNQRFDIPDFAEGQRDDGNINR